METDEGASLDNHYLLVICWPNALDLGGFPRTGQHTNSVKHLLDGLVRTSRICWNGLVIGWSVGVFVRLILRPHGVGDDRRTLTSDRLGKMRVGIERDADRGVSELFLNSFRMDTC